MIKGLAQGHQLIEEKWQSELSSVDPGVCFLSTAAHGLCPWPGCLGFLSLSLPRLTSLSCPRAQG